MKVNTGGVIPIIFASSVLYFPILLSNVLPSQLGPGAERHQSAYTWSSPTTWSTSSCTALLIIGFAYFYAAITFDPHQQAEIIRKQGGYIPGIRPGTADRAPPAEHPQPDHPARRPVPGVHRPAAVDRSWPSGTSRTIPFAGTTLLIAVGVGPRDHEADRQPADAAQLRGLPQVSDRLARRAQ